MKDKKALLVVSFGTSYPETLEQNITAVERAIAAALPDRVCFRAFTSGVILRKLEQRDGVRIDDVPCALERLIASGYTDVLIQPTHIINGEEYEKILRQSAPFALRFARLEVGKPLLTCAQDYLDVAAALMAQLHAPGPGEALLFMGHGTVHFANAAYCQLEYVLHDAGWGRAFVAAVEGYPALDEAMRRLRAVPDVVRVLLTPLMLVAGDHAQNDMAGPEPDTWSSRLESAGYTVSCRRKGLGENPGIRALFAAHARSAEEKR